MHLASDDDIIELITQALKVDAETHKIEFKDGRGGIGNQLYKEISAFSNSAGGGIIVFGVKEDRTKRPKNTVIDLVNAQELQEKLYHYFDEKMTCSGEYNIKSINYNGKSLVVVCISETPLERKPAFYTDAGINRGSYIRVGNVDRQATTDEVRAFLRYSPEYKFDQQPVLSADLSMIDRGKISRYLDASALRTGRSIDARENFEKTIANLKLLVLNRSKMYPSYSGMLLFSKDEPQVLSELNRYIVRCVRYSDRTVSSEIIDSSDVYGTLDSQVDQSLAFILRNIPRSTRIIDAKRVDQYEYPEDALREVIVNAVIHRDYSISQTYVHIAIFSDRIEISNPGTLPPGVTVENLKESQFSRNTTIAAIMRDLKYMEEFGRGIDLIYSRMRERGLPEPLFKNRSNSFKITLLGQNFNLLNERQIALWNALQERNMLTSKAAREMFPEVSRATINNDLRGLVEANLISQNGSAVSTFYEPNY